MFLEFSFEDSLNYFLKRESTQFFLSIAIRYLALGMVGIFEPIYLYLYFGRSVSPVLLFWAVYSAIFALTVIFSGRIMGRIGLKRTMLISNFFLFAYYISLFFIHTSVILLFVAVIVRSISASLYWPAFHTDFIRFSKRSNRSKDIGKMSAIALSAGIISPIIGGLILTSFGYLVLFVVVLLVLFASTFPLFLSKERHEVYTDSYRGTWQRIFKNKNLSLSLASLGIEGSIDSFLWPIFIFIIGVNYKNMGWISTFSLLISALFALYIGRIATNKRKNKLLNIGSIILSFAWVIKYFVTNTLSAFLAQNFYRATKTATLIPFRSTLYDRASAKRKEADEFIVYREIVINCSRFLFFIIMAGIFVIVPKVNISFFIAAIAAIGFSFISRPRLFSLTKIWKK